MNICARGRFYHADVFLVYGLNDVNQGRTVFAMLDDMMTLRQVVLSHHDSSTFAMAIIYFPLKMVKLSGEYDDVIMMLFPCMKT